MRTGRYPKILTSDAIVEVLCEIRFSGSSSAEAVLPGMLFHSLADTLKQIDALPHAQIPPLVRDNDAGLRYMPIQRLSGDNVAVIVGGHILGIACTPYIGWSNFSELIKRVLEAAHRTGQLGDVERYSLKYTNFFPTEVREWGKYLDSEIRLGSEHISSSATMIRSEFQNGSITEIVQIFSGTMRNQETNVESNGILVDVDVIQSGPSANFLQQPIEGLEVLHSAAKNRFFDVVSEEWVNERGAKYE